MQAQKGKESCRESFHLLRDHINNHVQNVGSYMDGKGHSNEASDGNKERVTGQWRKGNPCYKLAKNLAELCLFPSVLWKAGLVSDKIGYSAEEGFFFWPCGLQDLSSRTRDQTRAPLQWKLGFLTTAPPGKPPVCLFVCFFGCEACGILAP